MTNNEAIFRISNDIEFKELALDIFHEQARTCNIYADYLSALKFESKYVTQLTDIPFLPIEFFKSHQVIKEGKNAETIFSSSGTTGMQTSKHYVSDLSIYEKSFREAFQYFYGDLSETAVLALLPSYLERTGSSLIYMVNDLIKTSGRSESGYFLYNHEELYNTLLNLQNQHTRTILFGVTYALLDFIESYQLNFPELTIMETGGMKGKRKEMIREELHKDLCQGFGVTQVHAEYGMTELLSQAYSKGSGLFECPRWMKVFIRDLNDPFSYQPTGSTGGINIIDLANINSCSFISTQDLGRKNGQEQFEVLGRFDQSDIRGCNLLVQ